MLALYLLSKINGICGILPFCFFTFSDDVRLHIPEATETEVAEQIQGWLKHTKTRLVRTARYSIYILIFNIFVDILGVY